MIAQTGICQNKVRYLRFLWHVKCGEPLKFEGHKNVCPSCGWIRPQLPKLPNPVKVPVPTFRNGCRC